MIELKNITKKYPSTNNEMIIALENVNLKFTEGELIVLKGASGSGKSTILSLMAGLSKPTSGEIIINNERISKLTDDFSSQFRRKHIGFIFQKYNLIPNLTVKDNIILPLIPDNINQSLLEEKAIQVMSKFNILHKKDIAIQNLSGGEQQRVAIARAHINNPKIILADEPTANLDQTLSENFIDILKELKTENKTIIVATHDPLFFNLSFVDKIITIEKEKVSLCS